MPRDVGAACRPHDLFWVDDPAALQPVSDWPRWATPAWRSLAPVVVRRAPVDALRGVPVGLRGKTRSERCAAHAMVRDSIRKVTPEDIARDFSARSSPAGPTRPCLRTLASIARRLDDVALPWGVTGSAGFTLASGLDVLHAESDLDLLLRVPDRTDADRLRAVARLLQDASCRVDVQVETSRGAFALLEWCRTGGPVLLKTASGPRFCDDPWQEDTAS